MTSCKQHSFFSLFFSSMAVFLHFLLLRFFSTRVLCIGLAHKIPINPLSFLVDGEDLQGRMGEDPLMQVWKKRVASFQRRLLDVLAQKGSST